MLTRNALVTANVETSYGTDPFPGANTNAILVSAPKVSVEGDLITRDYVRSTLSPLGHIIGSKKAKVTFETELKGSGFAGTAPEIGVLFRGCGMDEIIEPLTSVTYTPLSTGHKSITLYVYLDGLLHKITGARGTYSFDMTAGKYGKVSWDFEGEYATPIDATLPTGTFNSTLPPLVVSANFTVNSTAHAISALAFSMNNTLAAPGNVNEPDGTGEIRITGRDPNGSFDPEATLIGTYDFWTEWENATKRALSITLGSTPGNIVDFDVDYAQYRQINYGEREGILTYEIPFTASASSAGDDEIEIIFT